MKIKDLVYGEYELPEFVDALAETDLCVRSRKLTQDSLPNYLLVKGPAPSRFEHGLGVAHLADLVVNANAEFEPHRSELIAAAVLHDAGNPACSHLLEDLLEAHNGHRGESHLGELMPGSETEKALLQYGIDPERVIKLVTGNEKPLSNIISGSMDVDNLDNTARYMRYVLAEKPHHDAEQIASNLRFTGTEWYLAGNSLQSIANWRKTRREVYAWVHDSVHAAACKMVYRAAELAFASGKLTDGFFQGGDAEAVEFLRRCGDAGARYLIDAAINWRWYTLAARQVYNRDVPEKHIELAKDWKKRKVLADAIASHFNLRPEQVCVGAAWGKDDRQVTLPVHTAKGKVLYDVEPAQDIFRFRIWIDSAVTIESSLIEEYVQNL